MAGLLGTVLRAALTARLGTMSAATSSYVRDQIDYGKSSLSSYVVGAGFYAVAGIFLIAALLVGASALFDWAQMHYGRFPAYGITGGALVVLALIAVAFAAAATRKHEKRFPSLSSRLRVAMKGPSQNATAQKAAPQRSVPSKPAPRDAVASARQTATDVLRSPASPRSARGVDASSNVQRVGLAAAIGLVGWALARRFTTPSPPAPPQPPQARKPPRR